jgi:hypothetical protein
MNPTEFQTSRQRIVQDFETKYAELKTRYSAALNSAKTETDRPKQCVLIKSALDTNGALTTLVSDFMRLNNEGGCNLNPGQVRKLQTDMEKYKTQYSDIQQGRDKLTSLEKSFAEVDAKATHVDGINIFYFMLISAGLIVLVGLVFTSGIRRALYAQPVAPVISRGFT